VTKPFWEFFGKDSSDHPTERVPPFSANRRKAVVLLWTTFHPLHSPADDSTAEFAGRKGNPFETRRVPTVCLQTIFGNPFETDPVVYAQTPDCSMIAEYHYVFTRS
jgi:hypothetical protein